jgi:hypothetical protein
MRVEYSPTDAELAAVMKRFTYHPPQPDQIPRYAAIRDWARQLATLILHTTPKGREQALALTKLEEAVMHANSAIAREDAAPEWLPDPR